MKTKLYPLLLIVAFSLSSCISTLKPFTKADKDELKLGKSELERIQFYVSKDIILQRKASQESSQIEGGKIILVDEKDIEEVVIKKGTPGVLEYYSEDGLIGITFEKDENHYLTFGPNPSQGGRYSILASEWKNQIGKVSYDGKTYYTSPGSSLSYLMVDLKKLKKLNLSKHKAKGRKVE